MASVVTDLDGDDGTLHGLRHWLSTESILVLISVSACRIMFSRRLAVIVLTRSDSSR
jgi:hypothetical protein